MEYKIKIAKINGIDIIAEQSESGEVFVPIKPICSAIGIDFATQYRKIQNDEFLNSTIVIMTTVASDEKDREMVALPLMYVYGWLATINPGKVNPESKDLIMKYRKECYDVLYNHFYTKAAKRAEMDKAEIELLEQLRKKLEAKREIGIDIKAIEKSIAEIRADRLNPQPSLFD